MKNKLFCIVQKQNATIGIKELCLFLKQLIEAIQKISSSVAVAKSLRFIWIDWLIY